MCLPGCLPPPTGRSINSLPKLGGDPGGTPPDRSTTILQRKRRSLLDYDTYDLAGPLRRSCQEALGGTLTQIRHLYHIERKLREGRAEPHLRAAVRAHQSRPIYQRLHRVLTRLKIKRRYLPRSGMGMAINYALNLWPLLGVYLADGRIEIDQNLVENAIRPTALGKKNWLFIGNAEAGERSAILYTIVECCRRRGLDPYAYLLHVLTRLPSATNWQIDQLTPEAWGRSRRHAA